MATKEVSQPTRLIILLKANDMKSPITGKKMLLHKEERKLSFRKEEFPVVYHCYLCDDSGEKFTSTELDKINMQQLYNQYRDKHNLPFPDEVKTIRRKYGLSAIKMAEVLGFGVNSYRNYESGEMPSNSNGKLIQLVNDPKKFRDLVELSEALDQEAKVKLLRKVDTLIENAEDNSFSFELEDYLLDGDLPDEFSGYRKSNLKRLTEMVVFFTERLKPWKTQMNKLLFYADFLMFKRTCFSMSGARYRAINMGPVPNNYNSIFEYMANNDEVAISYTEFPNGAVGEQFKPHTGRNFNAALFDEIELQVLDDVADRFKDVSTSDIIEISHKERAWIDNEAGKRIISYKYAFDLSPLRKGV